MNKYMDDTTLSKRQKRFQTGQSGHFPHGRPQAAEGEFTCGHCRFPVTTLRSLSGVHNRNHCPFCLWSRHMDLYRAGDRLSACKAPMRPVGLALKQVNKKYAGEQPGELMLVHACTECHKISINRIAADDDVEQILAIFERSLEMDEARRAALKTGGIEVLAKAEARLVQVRLLGNSNWR